MIELLFLGGAAFAGAAHAARQARAAHPTGPARRTQPGRAGGWTEPRPSLLVKAWKSAGGPYTEEEQLADAIADLGGRALGKAVRGTARPIGQSGRAAGRQGRRAGRWATRTAERRWERRERPHRAFIAFPHRRGHGDSGDQDNQARPAGSTPPGRDAARQPAPPRRQGTPPPLFPDQQAGGGPQPAPRPIGDHFAARSASPSAAPSRPGTAAAGAAGARRRARARVWAAGPPINMDPPTSDAEFIETSIDLQQFLRGFAAAVEDFTDEVMIRRMPAAVTNPLLQIGEHMTEASAAVQRGATVFEVIFEEAIDLAAAGIKFTGDDPV
ncbi:hypothetical protein [Actinomadura kijaniata]|uniref:hypothetical protein n=1 Tax=Actinomadura kijaniata TaxID=46161 RepID=UPI000A923345|nr:hypothetical protein [Actinomadura kijaniata]